MELITMTAKHDKLFADKANERTEELLLAMLAYSSTPKTRVIMDAHMAACERHLKRVDGLQVDEAEIDQELFGQVCYLHIGLEKDGKKLLEIMLIDPDAEITMETMAEDVETEQQIIRAAVDEARGLGRTLRERLTKSSAAKLN